ncbi:hypothetical protein G7Y89_g5534 [Cudoniella acicularis]|uniref:AB hydrolase-1 domain-containing protein n=1 Tax=Cudoniella acicularis TaxID=354080 RepID=A0A8H4RNP6_9HELO|nr:hypothetical protein G7Y89_g5534 [Cudoniella acicularis]
MSPSFTVLLCHGSYHTPEPYQPFLASLEARGIPAICPQLPTSSPSKLNTGSPSHPSYDLPPPPGGYPQQADDVAVILTLLNQLIVEEGRNILFMGHSSGGLTATAAAIPELQREWREKEGKRGGVIGVFYECAFLVPVGESVHSFFQPKDGSPPVIPPYCKFHQNGMEGLMSTVEGAKYFFNGLDDEKAKYYESTLTASTILTTVLENDAYPALPCIYLVTENDLALPAAYQEGMVALQNQREEVDIGVLKCPSGHSPHLTWMDGLVEEVVKFGNGLLG